MRLEMALVSALVVTFACGQAVGDSTDESCPEIAAAKVAVKKAVAAAVKDVFGNDMAKRKAARRTLLTLNGLVLEEMLVQTEGTQVERAELAGELCAAAIRSARQGQLLASLTESERKAVIALSKVSPDAFGELFSEDAEVASDAASDLINESGEAGQAILRWAIRHPHRRVRLEALRTAQFVEEPSRKTRDALFALAEESAGVTRAPDPDKKLDRIEGEIRSELSGATLRALVAMKDDRVLSYLLDKLFSPGSGWGASFRGSVPAKLILEINDTRTVVTLMDHIDEDRPLISHRYGDEPEVIVKVGDVAMHIVLRKTGQEPAEYGFHTSRKWAPIVGYTGFTDDTKRRDARAKLRQWWQEHSEEYEGVEKIPLKAPRTRRVHPRPANAPNATVP